MFMTDVSRWDEVAKAHGEIFGDIRPAATGIGISALVQPEFLIEIEVDAVL
jgi:enamine deaminase RidA (YjgF/YER057c/UK114 family)